MTEEDLDLDEIADATAVNAERMTDADRFIKRAHEILAILPKYNRQRRQLYRQAGGRARPIQPGTATTDKERFIERAYEILAILPEYYEERRRLYRYARKREREKNT